MWEDSAMLCAILLDLNIDLNQYFFLLHEFADFYADVVGPQEDCPDSLPKEWKIEKTDREQPARKPWKGREAVLLDFDFFVHCYSLVIIFYPVIILSYIILELQKNMKQFPHFGNCS